MVGILRLADDEPASGPLDELQRSLDDDMSGRSSWSPYVDHDRAKRAVERLKKYGKLFVSWATAEEVRAFDSLDS
jgi:hypothetical protein